MKRLYAILIALLMPFVMASAAKYNVWGRVIKADDGKYYLNMYKNIPAKVTANFYFKYKGGDVSELFVMEMADSVATQIDPVPVDRPVREVVVQNIVYSTVDSNGKVYSTRNPDDPTLGFLVQDMFDLYSDIFWFSAHSPRSNNRVKTADDVDLTKLSDDALLTGALVVAAAGVGMATVVSKYWSVPDWRFPYFSITPQAQYFFMSGMVRDVFQFKYRFGNKGGFNIYADLGATTGTMKEKGMFDSGFTWGVGAGLDLGNFSLTLSGKPATSAHDENFVAFQLGYVFDVTDHFGIDLKAGASVMQFDGEDFFDIPASIGTIWRF